MLIPRLWLLRMALSFYYRWSMQSTDNKLRRLLAEKRRLLEQVKDTQTYKKAHAILERFAPEQLEPISKVNRLSSHLYQLESKLKPIPSNVPVLPSTPTNVSDVKANKPLFSSSHKTLSSVCNPEIQPLLLKRPLLPRPILPCKRSSLDRIVEYIVGDGPNNRYALICSRCCSHNGMALKEEYEFLSYRCCYCGYFNPAKKERPQAQLALSYTVSENTQSEYRTLAPKITEHSVYTSESNMEIPVPLATQTVISDQLSIEEINVDEHIQSSEISQQDSSIDIKQVPKVEGNDYSPSENVTEGSVHNSCEVPFRKVSCDEVDLLQSSMNSNALLEETGEELEIHDSESPPIEDVVANNKSEDQADN